MVRFGDPLSKEICYFSTVTVICTKHPFPMSRRKPPHFPFPFGGSDAAQTRPEILQKSMAYHECFLLFSIAHECVSPLGIYICIQEKTSNIYDYSGITHQQVDHYTVSPLLTTVPSPILTKVQSVIKNSVMRLNLNCLCIFSTSILYCWPGQWTEIWIHKHRIC